MTRQTDQRLLAGELHRTFLASLGRSVIWHSELDEKPLEIDLEPPLPSHLRAYLFNATRPPGGRALGEHKVQLIAPGQRRGTRGVLDFSNGRIVLLVGYQTEDEVFILWDAYLHSSFAWSANLQVKGETITAALGDTIATQQRRIRRHGVEVVLACRPQHLGLAITERVSLTRRRLVEN